MSRPTTGSAHHQPRAAPPAPGQYGEAGEPVGTGVQAVGNQRRGADLMTDADAIAGDELVAEETGQGSSGDGPEVSNLTSIEEPVDGLQR